MSEGNEDQLGEPKNSFLYSEGAFLGYATAIVYLHAYIFQLGYLSHYGIGNQFVEVNLVSLLWAFVAILAAVALTIQALSFVPKDIVEPIWTAVFFWLIPGVTIFYSIRLYVEKGFVGYFFVASGLALFVTVSHVFFLVDHARNGHSLFQGMRKSVERERENRKHFVGMHVLKFLMRDTKTVTLLFALLGVSLSYPLGWFYAGMASEHTLVELNDGRFVVVKRNEEGVLLSQIESETSNQISVSGLFQIRQFDTLTGEAFYILDQPKKVVRVELVTGKKSRVSFEEFMSSWGKPSDEKGGKEQDSVSAQ